MVELCYGCGCCLLDVRIVILQGVFERLAEILSDPLNADAAHRSDCKCAHEWVLHIARILLERVDRHDGQVGLGLGIVDDVKIDKLLELNGLGGHAAHHMREQGAHIFADRHHRDNLLGSLLALLMLV